MSTIYTLNGKVLKNSANGKWLIKAVPPTTPEGGTRVLGYRDQRPDAN